MPSVKNYLSLVKFSHTIFAMPFAMIGFVLGLFGYRLIPFRILLNNNISWSVHYDLEWKKYYN